MNGGHVIGIRGHKAPTTEAPPANMGDSEIFTALEAIKPRPRWVAAAGLLATALSIGWVVGMTWLARGELNRLGPVALVEFVASLCIVPALFGIVWMVAARSSTFERLFEGAREMRLEADLLARTVGRLSNSIEANRDAFAEQVRSLAAIGDGATASLAALRRGLSEELAQADSPARTLAEAARDAEARLAVLLTSLPEAKEATEAAGASLARLGESAVTQIAALQNRLEALAEQGREADAVASGSAQALAAQAERVHAISHDAKAQLEAAAAAMSSEVEALLGRTAMAVSEWGRQIAAQGEALRALVESNQAALTLSASENADALAGRIGAIEQVIDRIGRRLEAQRETEDGIMTELEGWIDRVEGRIEALHDEGTRRAGELAGSFASLSGDAEAMIRKLRAGDGAAAKTIETTETLLIALDAAARELDETLPGALGRLDGRLDETRRLIGAAEPELRALVTASENTHDAVGRIAAEIADQQRKAEAVAATMADGLTAGREKATELHHSVDAALTDVNRLIEDAAPRLVEALLRVRDTAAVAADRARETLAAVIPDAADALEAATRTAIRRAAGSEVEAQIASMSEAASTAVDAATRAAERLQEELARVGAASALVDTRLRDADAERRAHDREGFARRASLLIEAMNSASIDLTRSLAPEISDAAWAVYLKGDRGIFTRRAVRLLDRAQQRRIANLYNEDASFREQVNQYIHDFESMLRAILAQRDGTALGVTLLSSDMGKLYVAMAQAIERLR